MATYKEVQWNRYRMVHVVDIDVNPRATLCGANKYFGQYWDWDKWWTPEPDSDDHRCRKCVRLKS